MYQHAINLTQAGCRGPRPFLPHHPGAAFNPKTSVDRSLTPPGAAQIIGAPNARFACASRGMRMSGLTLLAAAPANAATTEGTDAINAAPKATASAGGSAGRSVLANPDAPTFQDAILKLQDYWSKAADCAVWLPHNTEVGAGNTETSSATHWINMEWVLASETGTMKPANLPAVCPGNEPGMYATLETGRIPFRPMYSPSLGGRPTPHTSELRQLVGTEATHVQAHDVRFVEDNWESPVLGAWGLGWEVWLDGMEVTQFTYFQQAGGKTLDAPAVEITYGLERILMSLQTERKTGQTRRGNRTTDGKTGRQTRKTGRQTRKTGKTDAEDRKTRRGGDRPTGREYRETDAETGRREEEERKTDGQTGRRARRKDDRAEAGETGRGIQEDRRGRQADRPRKTGRQARGDRKTDAEDRKTMTR
eukprot:gene30663-35681_t